MAQLWMDGYDQYGIAAISVLHMLQGPYAELNGDVEVVVPSFGARTGEACLNISGATTGTEHSLRRVLGTNATTLIASFAIYMDALPSLQTGKYLNAITALSAANDPIISLRVGTEGSILVMDADNTTILAQTASPVLVAGSWQHVEVQFVISETIGSVEVRVDEVVVIDVGTLDTGALPIAQIEHINRFGTGNETYFDDVIMRDATGSFNTGFQGDLRVATLQPVANGDTEGWTTRSIQKLDIGVLDLPDAARDQATIFASDAALKIGTQDFAVETFVRFAATLDGVTEHNIFGEWREDNNNRSYRLYASGAGGTASLTFETSTDGAVGTVVKVHEFPFVPLPNRYYHVAITRDGTTSRLFLDGQQIGIDQTDASDYFGSSAATIYGAIQGAGATTVLSGSGVNGWLDGSRITIGEPRYIANFSPPTDALPDTIGGDPLYASVELLLNYDDADNLDQSSNGFTGILANDADILFPDDSVAYQTIDGLEPNDANFVEASLVAAVGTFELTTNPLDTETVTLGADTYTFQTVLTNVANNVLIGALPTDSLDNLRAAVNLEAGSGTLYAALTLQNDEASLSDLPDDQILATARVPGTAANSEPTTTTVTGATWSAATLLGGLDIPTNSQFLMSALPADVTGIRAVAIVGRNFKLDTGSSEMQMSLVTLAGGVSAGQSRPVSTSPTYYEDTIEQDPNTAGALTPTTINGSQIRLNRTT